MFNRIRGNDDIFWIPYHKTATYSSLLIHFFSTYMMMYLPSTLHCVEIEALGCDLVFLSDN